jgi:hypothetical protein
MLVRRVAGIIVVNEPGTRSAAKGTAKIVGVVRMQRAAGDQLEGDRLQICPAAGSRASSLWK